MAGSVPRDGVRVATDVCAPDLGTENGHRAQSCKNITVEPAGLSSHINSWPISGTSHVGLRCRPRHGRSVHGPVAPELSLDPRQPACRASTYSYNVDSVRRGDGDSASRIAPSSPPSRGSVPPTRSDLGPPGTILAPAADATAVHLAGRAIARRRRGSLPLHIDVSIVPGCADRPAMARRIGLGMVVGVVVLAAIAVHVLLEDGLGVDGLELGPEGVGALGGGVGAAARVGEVVGAVLELVGGAAPGRVVSVLSL